MPKKEKIKEEQFEEVIEDLVEETEMPENGEQVSAEIEALQKQLEEAEGLSRREGPGDRAGATKKLRHPTD